MVNKRGEPTFLKFNPNSSGTAGCLSGRPERLTGVLMRLPNLRVLQVGIYFLLAVSLTAELGFTSSSL